MLATNARPRVGLRLPQVIDGLASYAARHAWVALPFLALPAVLPYWLSGFPETADGHLHLIRLALLDRYFEQGWLYPRWMPGLVLGRGYPLLNFYAPASYYLAEALHLLGLGYQTAMALAFAILIIFAGAGMYLLAGEILGPSQRAARLVAATAYMYSPYLLANSFVRGAIAEVGAQALLPWVFWSLHRLLTRGQLKRDLVPAALTVAAVAVTHNITLLLLPLAWLGYVLALWWQGGRRRELLLWAGAAGVLGMLLSAFFWLPMVVERQYLANTAYDISARFLGENVWSWRNFLDLHFFYRYGYDVPYRLGLVQLGLALAGFFMARRRDVVWLFWAGLVLVAGLAIGQWTLQIWLHVKPLLIVQFPWRLLSLMSLPLALFTGGAVLCLHPAWLRSAITVGLLALIILAQRPNPSWVTSMVLDSAPVTPASATRFEIDSGALGTSNSSEFLPSWVKSTHLLDAGQPAPAAHQVELRSASAFDLSFRITGGGGPVRISTFYYPGWTAILDGREATRTYPSTSLGLLTIDMPPGTHELAVHWQGTGLARLADIISLVALLAAALWCLSLRPRQAALAIPLLILLALGSIAMFYRPPMKPLSVPPASVKDGSVQLLGYQLEGDGAQHVLIRPFWYTTGAPPADFRVRWLLLNGSGQVVAQVERRPYYGATSAADWPPGTITGDVYRLPLPSGAPGETYQLAVQMNTQGEGAAPAPVVVGPADVSPGPQVEEGGGTATDVRFGDSISLRGYSLSVDGRLVALDQTPPPVVHAGDRLEYSLYWQGKGPISEDYHGFVHLLDQSGKSLTERDHMAGTIYAPPVLWDAVAQPGDAYRLIIPPASASGLYSADVGLYSPGLRRLPVKTGGGAADASYYRLPPVKVVGELGDKPQQRLSVRLGDLASLTGYTLQAPPSVHPGDELRLTLYYRAKKNSAQNLTRFAQLHSPELGMAAQNDGIPQGGENPTWSWVPGEEIREEILLPIAPDARAGRYTLAVGLYDAQNGARVPAFGEQGQSLPDSRVVLTELEVLGAG